jgi:hypothetical protein
MCWPFGSRGLILLAVGAAALSVTIACGGSTTEAGSVGTSGSSDAPVLVDVQPTYLTIENKAGVPLVEGRVELVLAGLRPPFTARLPRVEHMGRQNISFQSFRGIDGTEFNRRLGRVRRVRVTATDVTGKPYTLEVPFQ